MIGAAQKQTSQKNTVSQKQKQARTVAHHSV
jgi:hypothetical protein